MGIIWTEPEEFLLAHNVRAEGMFICPLSSLEEIKGLRHASGTLQEKHVGTDIALGMGVGLDLISNFFTKHRFLTVILPDPLTLIRYR